MTAHTSPWRLSQPPPSARHDLECLVEEGFLRVGPRRLRVIAFTHTQAQAVGYSRGSSKAKDLHPAMVESHLHLAKSRGSYQATALRTPLDKQGADFPPDEREEEPIGTAMLLDPKATWDGLPNGQFAPAPAAYHHPNAGTSLWVWRRASSSFVSPGDYHIPKHLALAAFRPPQW